MSGDKWVINGWSIQETIPKEAKIAGCPSCGGSLAYEYEVFGHENTLYFKCKNCGSVSKCNLDLRKDGDDVHRI